MCRELAVGKTCQSRHAPVTDMPLVSRASRQTHREDPLAESQTSGTTRRRYQASGCQAVFLDIISGDEGR